MMIRIIKIDNDKDYTDWGDGSKVSVAGGDGGGGKGQAGTSATLSARGLSMVNKCMVC